MDSIDRTTVKARYNDMSRAGFFDRYNTIIVISNASFTWVPRRGLLRPSLYRNYRYIGNRYNEL
jgi:hypothetical protein